MSSRSPCGESGTSSPSPGNFRFASAHFSSLVLLLDRVTKRDAGKKHLRAKVRACPEISLAQEDNRSSRMHCGHMQGCLPMGCPS